MYWISEGIELEDMMKDNIILLLLFLLIVEIYIIKSYKVYLVAEEISFVIYEPCGYRLQKNVSINYKIYIQCVYCC